MAGWVVDDVRLSWIPLGAGAHVVRLSGRIYERLAAGVQRRRPCDLYHSALQVAVPEGDYVVEMTPVVDAHGPGRGVVAEGPVGSKWLGGVRLFRYEIRRWQGGVIPALDAAVATVVVPCAAGQASRILALVADVPTLVWGRDELGAGDMWNSNSVTAWVLARAGVDMAALGPPAGGRAPGWDAGLVAASTAGRAAVRRSSGWPVRRIRPLAR